MFNDEPLNDYCWIHGLGHGECSACAEEAAAEENEPAWVCEVCDCGDEAGHGSCRRYLDAVDAGDREYDLRCEDRP